MKPYQQVALRAFADFDPAHVLRLGKSEAASSRTVGSMDILDFHGAMDIEHPEAPMDVVDAKESVDVVKGALGKEQVQRILVGAVDVQNVGGKNSGNGKIDSF
jgi:hypothetical protein